LPHLKASQYPNASAVIVRREVEYSADMKQLGYPSYVVNRHQLLAILDQAGLKQAAITIWLGPNDELPALRAAPVSPNGAIHELTPEDVHSDQASVQQGGRRVKLREKVFRLSGVEVGSLVEFFSTVETTGPLFWTIERIDDEFPILAYEATL